MNREELTVEFTKKVQVEQYEPETIGVAQTVQLEEDDDVDEIRDQLHEENVAFVGREVTSRLAAKRMEDNRNEDDD